MTIFNIFALVGGLALFLYGMNLLSESLESLSGSQLEKILAKLTSSRFRGLLLGTFITAVIQSSSAMTVITVGFVNSGILQLSQTSGIIIGANIGTTATSWILSLSGIEGGNIFLDMLKPTSFSPVIAIIGVIIMMSTKNQKNRDIAKILLGFAILFFGMDSMKDAVSPLANDAQFASVLTAFTNPVIGVIAGIVLTAFFTPDYNYLLINSETAFRTAAYKSAGLSPT